MTAIAITPHVRQVQRRSPEAPTGRRSTVRLTRRGRLVVLMTGLLAALLLGVVVGAASIASEHAPATEVVTVSGGQTLWSIADEAAGDGSTAAMVDRIQELNDLEGGLVMTGQQLRVPVAD